MTQATITETASDTLRAAATRMWRQQTGSLLIAERGRLTGIITERGILKPSQLRPSGRSAPKKKARAKSR